MSTLLKHHRMFLLLLAGQALCLAIGLWTQHKFLAAHADWQAEQAAAGASVPVEATGRFEHTIVHAMSYVWIVALQAIAGWLVISRMKGTHERKHLQSREEAMRTAKELLMTRDAVVFGLAKLAESRDPDTGMHLERIALYSTRLAAALRKHRKFRDRVSANFVNTIGISSALHDIGKVGVEDAILLKPAKLTHDEHFRIQSHTVLGGECIRQFERRLGNSNFLEMAREIALSHHERWDGAGYPTGLKGEDIPLAARIVSIADVYDAMRMKRVYKPARSHEECVEIIRSEAGKQFDPHLVEVFLSIQHQFQEISQRFGEKLDETAARPAGPARMTTDQAQLVAAVVHSSAPSLSIVCQETASA